MTNFSISPETERLISSLKVNGPVPETKLPESRRKTFGEVIREKSSQKDRPEDQEAGPADNVDSPAPVSAPETDQEPVQQTEEEADMDDLVKEHISEADEEAIEYGHYDKWLKQLADGQRYKLHANRHKGKIEDVELGELMRMLRGEVAELEEAVGRGNQIEMMLVVADLSNFAMAIYIKALKDAAA